MTEGFIQIYNENFVCSTYTNNFNMIILVTGEEHYLKNSGFDNDDCLKRASQTKFIDVLDTYNVPFENIKLIFQHAKDKILNCIINDKTLKILGDNGVLYSTLIYIDIPDTNQEIVLKGSKFWLRFNKIDYF